MANEFIIKNGFHSKGDSQVTGSLGITANITATSFVKSGGTSTQFLKADGSVDSNTYLTSVGTIDLASGVTGILPVGNGGTGAITFTTDGILIGNGTSALTNTTDFTYNTTNKLLSAPTASFDHLIVSQVISSSIINTSGSNIFGDEATDTQTLNGSVILGNTLTDNSQTTALFINGSNTIKKRLLKANAFTDTTIPVIASTSVTDLSDVTSAGSGQIITSNERTAIGTNSNKTSFPGFGTTSATALVGNTPLLQIGTNSNTALAGNTTAANIGGLTATSNLSDLNNATTARTNLGVAIGTDVLAYNATVQSVAGGTYAFSSLASKPTTIAGYGITDAFDGAFSSLTSKPTTIAGYGITDAFDGAFSSLTSKPTTIAGYGITDSLQIGVTSTTALAGDTTVGTVVTGNGGGSGDTLSQISIGGTTFTVTTGTGNGTVDTSGTPINNDYAKFTDGNTIEGRSFSEVRSDLNVADGADVTPSWVPSVNPNYLTSVGTINLASGVTGTLPVANGGTGATTFTAGRVLIGNGTSALTTDSGFTYSSNKLGIDGTITSNTKDIISNASSATTLLIGDVDGNDSIEQLDLKAMSLTAISITDSQVEFTGDVGVKISNAPDTTSENTSLMISSTGAVQKRELGSNAFNSTAFLTSVTGTAPIVSSGGTTPAISINAATNSAAGSMSAIDKGKIDAITVTSGVNLNTMNSSISSNTSNISTNTSAISGKAASGANTDITSIINENLKVGGDGSETTENYINFEAGKIALTQGTNLVVHAGSDFRPNTNNSMNLGNSTYMWADAYSRQFISDASTISTPAFVIDKDSPTTGFYSSGNNQIGITIGGSQIGYFNANGIQLDSGIGESNIGGHLQVHCLGVGTGASTTQGEIRATGDVIANYSSDKRLKENIKPISGALDKLFQISGVTFDWIEKEEIHSHKGHDVGVIAQEVEEVLPEVVVTRDNGYKAVNYEKIVPLLIESIKDLKAEIDELKKSK